MPYKSEAQRKFFNSPAGKEKIGEEEVEHWNEGSKGMKVPEKAIDKAIRLCDKISIKDVMFKPGQVFRNGNGYELKVDSYTTSGKINVKQNGRVFETTEGSLQNIISKNGYSKVNDAGKSGVHRITYKDIDGKKTTEVIKGSVESVKNRINELERHDCKVIKQEMFIDWR